MRRCAGRTDASGPRPVGSSEDGDPGWRQWRRHNSFDQPHDTSRIEVYDKRRCPERCVFRGSKCLTAHGNAGGMGLVALALAADRFAVTVHGNYLRTVIPALANLHSLCGKDACKNEGKADDEMQHALERSIHKDSRPVPIHEDKMPQPGAALFAPRQIRSPAAYASCLIRRSPGGACASTRQRQFSAKMLPRGFDR